MLLKTWTMSDLKQFDGRWVATKMVLSDQLRKGSQTVLTIEDVSFDVKLRGEVFTRRWLERK